MTSRRREPVLLSRRRAGLSSSAPTGARPARIRRRDVTLTVASTKRQAAAAAATAAALIVAAAAVAIAAAASAATATVARGRAMGNDTLCERLPDSGNTLSYC